MGNQNLQPSIWDTRKKKKWYFWLTLIQDVKFDGKTGLTAGLDVSDILGGEAGEGDLTVVVVVVHVRHLGEVQVAIIRHEHVRGHSSDDIPGFPLNFSQPVIHHGWK